jgi:C-terminal processing protease CtpA/Prc
MYCDQRGAFAPLLKFFVALVLCFCVSPLNAQNISLQARQSDFKMFVQGFEQNYAYIDNPDKPWLTWNQQYAEAVSAASSKEQFAAVIADALAELHDFHAEVRSSVPNRWLPAPTFTDIWAEWRGDKAVVVAVRRGSDAEQAGVHAGDRITQIGSQSIDDAVEARLGRTATGADAKARSWALLSVLTGRAEEARAFTLLDSGGGSRVVNLPVKRNFRRSPGSLWQQLPGNIGLIRFNNSLGEQGTVSDFDTALNQLRNTRGLILDLRDVPSGGDSSVALGIMGRFIRTTLPYQRHRIPHYGQPDVERDWIELVTPRGPFTYKAPVVILVDHWTGSMGEGMAIGFDAMHRAVVLGTPMAHLAGAVSDFNLPMTGVDVAIATEQLFHVDGTPGQDWLPPILVTDPVTPQDDPILQRGLSEIKHATFLKL